MSFKVAVVGGEELAALPSELGQGKQVILGQVLHGPKEWRR